MGAGLFNLSMGVKYLGEPAPTGMVKCGIDRAVKRDYYGRVALKVYLLFGEYYEIY